MKRIIFGRGKVSSIISQPSDTVFSRQECDISNIDHVKQILNDFRPDVVINCAAKTNLENCQKNKQSAYISNVLGVSNILQVCSDTNVKLVHISSGCLFDGNKKISKETDPGKPAVWYTWTKLWADQYIEQFGYPKYLILRPRQLISKTPHPTNMITKFYNMDYIPAIEEDNSVTCIEDFSDMIDHLLKLDCTGIFNCCNTGTITPLQIAEKIRDEIKPSLRVEKVSYKDLLKSLPNRRVNTVLSCDKLVKTGFTPRSASKALEWCVKNYEK